MALYKVGNRYLSEQEYQEHCESNLILGLFVAGAISAAIWAGNLVSEDLPRIVRFAFVVGAMTLGGGALAMLAGPIRKMAWAIPAGALAAGTGYVIWTLV